MSIASGYGPNWTTAESWGLDAQRRVVELEQQLAAAQAEVRELRERAEKAERNYQWMVERAADQHLSGYRELARRAADAENVADGLRAELARVRGLPLMARRSWMRRDTDYFVVHGDFCLEIKALNGRAPYYDEGGELLVCAETRDLIERDQVDAEAQPDGICRIADTDEHGLPVIERTADMPKRAKYRLSWITQAGDAGGDVEYTDSLPLVLEANRSGAVSERIEDYRPAAQESGAGPWEPARD